MLSPIWMVASLFRFLLLSYYDILYICTIQERQIKRENKSETEH